MDNLPKIYTQEEIAQEVYFICRKSGYTLKECLEIIAKNLLNDIAYVNDEDLEKGVRKYRESYTGLQKLVDLISNKRISATIAKMSPNSLKF